MNARTIAWLLAVRRRSPFHARRYLAVVPNVSWGLLEWEADLLAVSSLGYVTEIEIKISIADWKADLKKAKFRPEINWKSLQMIRRFYYAAPMEIAKRYQEIKIPEYAGVIAVDDNHIEVLKKAKDRPGYRKLTETEKLKLLRLAAIKAWRMAYDPALEGSSTLPTEDELADANKETQK